MDDTMPSPTPEPAEAVAVRPAKGARDAAIVISALGTDAGAAILNELAPHEVETIVREIKDLPRVPIDEVTLLLSQLRDQVEAQSFAVSGGFDRARDLLRRSHGQDADSILERIMAASVAAPFQFLRARRPEHVLSALSGEHPQIIALVLSYLPLGLSARVMEGLDVADRAAVAERFARLETADSDVVAEVEAALAARVGSGAVVESGSAKGGVKPLAQLLNSVSRDTERGVLAELEMKDPGLAAEVRDLMFVFEDLVHLDDRGLQEVLRDAGSKTVALALKDAPNNVKTKIERNLSQRAAEDIAEISAGLGPVRRADVEAAQSELVRSARRLEEEGRLVIMRGDTDVIS